MAAFISSRGTTTTNTITLTNPTDIAVGSVLVLAGYNNAATAMASLTDSRSNTWTINQQRTNSFSGRRLYHAVCRVATAYQAGDTVTWTGPAATRIFEVAEYSGAVIAPTTYIDGSVSGQNPTANTGFVSSGDYTNGVANCLLLGAVGYTFASTADPDSASGYTLHTLRTNGNERIRLMYKIVSTIATDDLYWDHNATATGNSVASISAIRIYGGGVPRSQAILVA